jgi:hypothetical protein
MMVDEKLQRRVKARANSFWFWLLRLGLRRLLWNRWLIAHILVGCALAWFVPGRLSFIAGSALIPLASILVGLTFAWSGNAASLLQSVEIQRVGAQDAGEKFRTYVFTYQGALLLVLVLTTLWSLLASGIANEPEVTNLWVRMFGRSAIFTLSSLTVRECWSACVGVQQMLLVQMDQRQAKALTDGSAEPTRSLKPKSS